MLAICTAMLDSPREQDKFRQLYNTYRALMLYVAQKVLNHPQDAEDAVQQAFLAIAQNMNKVDAVPSRQAQAFVVIITERKALNVLRRRKKHLSLDEALTPGLPVLIPEDDGLAAAMAALPAAYRQAILLHHHIGYSVKETAQLMALTPAGVEKLLWRAKKRLRQILEKEEIGL